MADVEAAVAQSRSSRTYEDALVALNTLITRKADAPITDPVTRVLNWQMHFQSLFRCLEAGVPAFTAPQQEEAMGSLQKRANELGITLEVAPSLEDYGLHNLPLGLGGEHQHVNAALAVALCKQWTMARAPSEHTTGLQKVLSSGRLPELK